MKQKRITLIIGAIVIIILIIVTIVALTKKKVVPDRIDSTQKDTLAVAQVDDTDITSLPETEESTDSVIPEIPTDIEFPETMKKLLGEWISLDESTTCTIDTNSILIHFLGNEAVPEESRYYEYVLISDTQMSITYAGSAPSVYSFSIWEKDGETYFTSPIKAFASTYVRVSVTSPSDEEPGTDSSEFEIILDSQEIDYTEYNKEFEVIIRDILPGTWKGTYDYWERTDSPYHIFTFSADGTYTYNYEDYTETGTYSFSCDLNNKFSSTMYLVYADGEHTFNFNVSKSEPYKMNIEDEDYPTLTKE